MRKRGSGEGSIYQRKGGRWVSYLRGQDGTKRFFYGASMREVRDKLQEARSAVSDGIPIANDTLRLGDYLVEWLETQRSRLRRRTWLGYESVMRVHVIPALGHLKLKQLEPRHVEQLYAAMLAKGLSPRTVLGCHLRLHRALRVATRQGLVVRNVSDLVDAPRIGRKEMKTLSQEQALAFLETAADSPHEALFVLALSTGMRAGELLGLRWRDVALDAGHLSVTQTLDKPGKEPIFGEPKTRSSRRRVWLTDRAIAALRRHRSWQTEERLHTGAEWTDYDLVFTNRHGGPLDITNLGQRDFRRLLRDAGLPIIRFHDLRHTAATLLLEQAVHPRVVADLLGHSTVALTLDTYSHVTERLHQGAVTALNQVFG